MSRTQNEELRYIGGKGSSAVLHDTHTHGYRWCKSVAQVKMKKDYLRKINFKRSIAVHMSIVEHGAALLDT